jgi:heat-inducible transcriptional repressor
MAARIAFGTPGRLRFQQQMATRSTTSGLHPAAADALDERSRRVLSAIVRDYIHDGQPIGSHAIARRPDVDVSSATVRAVMADLEEMGYLEKPHTSAGRVPTSRGYRYYVDALLRVKQPLPEEREQIERRAQEAAAQFDGLMAAASRVLHALTKHAGVVAAPRPQSERLQRIEFLQLREGRVLALLVSRSGAVRNRLITLRPGEAASAAELERSAQYLNELIADLTLAEAQLKLRAQLERDRRELDGLQARALALGAQAVTPDEPAVHIEGQASLLEDRSLDVAKIRALFKALGEKERLLSVLDRTLEAQELQIFIGAESGIVEPDLAIVAAPYRLNGEVVGALGVIGPTRMDYARVVPLVELTARTVGLTLDASEEG